MVNKNIMNSVIFSMSEDLERNVKRIINVFGSLDYKDDENQSLLHILVDNIYDEEKCFLAIKSLLKSGMNPNLEADFELNFIQTALYAGYSEEFIIKIIKEALKYGLDVNHRDDDKDTMLHTAIYSDEYLGDVENIYDLLYEAGFNSNLLDHDSRNLVEAMIFQNTFTNEQLERFRNKFNKRTNNNCVVLPVKKIEFVPKINENKDKLISSIISEEDLKELKKFGKILNYNSYITSPIVGREKELKNLMITLAQEKKNPLIVGESGVGKTSIVEELVYRIINGNVPKFLKDKIILEVNPSDVVAGCQYVGMFEENMTKLMKLCEKYDIILFIDEVHTVYGVGSSKNKDTDMAAIIKHHIDRSKLKVIGTTTEKEYEEYFSSDALKRRFEKVVVKEPDEKTLYEIIDKVINDYLIKNDIRLENENLKEEIINIIIYITDKKRRVYNDVLNNPDLAISIIDKAFAFSKLYDSEYLTIEHIIESIELSDRIYENTRIDAIERLKRLKDNKDKKDKKILIYELNKYK